MLITSYASNSGFADTNAVNVPYKRRAIHLWEYIKTKTDSLYTVIGHTHDDRYLRLIGGTMTGTINRRSGGSTISGRDHAIIRQTYAPGGSSWNPIACVDTETGTWTLGHLSHGDSDTNFHFCFSTNTDYNAGNDGFGSGLDADLLDGQHADKYIMVPTTIDASTLDINTYYPVTIWLPTKNTRIDTYILPPFSEIDKSPPL